MKQQLLDRIALGKQNDEPMPHLLLVAPSEMGKATCARAIAAERGVGIQETAAELLEKGLDLSGILTHINRNEVLLIENIDLLRGLVAKLLLEFLSEGQMSIWIGPRRHTMNIAPATVIATTSRPWQLTPLFRRWFVSISFGQYSAHEIAEVLTQLAALEGLEIERSAAELLAAHCQGTPGNALALLKRAKTHYRSMTATRITAEAAQRLLHLLGYDLAEDVNVTLSDRLRAMSGIEFEQYVADLFRCQGYVADLTAASGDHGIDILLKKGGRAGAVQCKRWTDLVGEPVVRDFLGAMIGAGVADGFIAATSSFTDQAWRFANSHGITLLDLDSIIGMAGKISAAPADWL